MRSKRSLIPLFFLFSVTTDVFELKAQPSDFPLIKPTERGRSIKIERDRTVIRQRRVVVDLARLRGKDNNRFRLPLFGAAAVVIVRDRQETPRPNTLIWYGRVEGQAGSSVILSNVGEALAGDLMTNDRNDRFGIYQIRYLGNRVHVLNQIDPSRFPREDPSNQKPPSPPPSNADPCGADPASIIDVLAVYTGAARAAASPADPSDASGIEAEIYAAVAATNQAYENSGVAHRIRLVHLQEVSYFESNTAPTDLARLEDPATTLGAAVLALRNTYSADVVAMIVRSLDFCGWSTTMEVVEHAFESKAYAVVRRSCSVTNLSFAHELGHIMGGRHEREADPEEDKPFPFNHGFLVKSPTVASFPWRTVMAVDLGCQTDPPVNCTRRVPHFSSPAVRYPVSPPGDVTGSATEDNRMALNETASTVANFRCASPGVNNVWMQDSPNDTGAEPDPLTASEAMWKSPALWVRNTQDAAGMHAHDHENPIAGKTNWVYAELLNGGGKISGNLELYWAGASTALVWPAGWTLISSTPVVFTSPSTRIVETTWTPAQAGHFCLLARWSSVADPMTHAETAELESNVRNNNNLVWRNLNVIDLSANQSADADFEVRPPDGQETPTSIALHVNRPFEVADLGRVRIALVLDETLFAAWRRGGTRAKGFRQDGSELVLEGNDAVLENIALGHGAIGRLKVRFQRTDGPARPEFIVDVVQLTAAGAARPVGGVSYMIRTKRAPVP